MRTFYFLVVLVCFGTLQANEREFFSVLPPTNMEEWNEQKEFLKENGYLWIRNFFTQEEVALLQQSSDDINIEAKRILELRKFEGDCSEIDSLIVVAEAADPSQVCRAEDLLECYPRLNSLIGDTVNVFIENLLGERYVSFKDKLNFKWPGGGAFVAHQDFPAFEFLNPRDHINAMVCVDEATLENGCLQVAKDWRRTFVGEEEVNQDELTEGRAILPYIVGGMDHGSIQPQYVEKITWIPLKTSAGDLVIFNSFVPHYSEPNLSQGSRRAMFFTYNKLSEGECRSYYYDMKRNDPKNPIFHFGTPTDARDKN